MFDKILSKAKTQTDAEKSGKVTTEEPLKIPGKGDFVIDKGTIKIPGEEQVLESGVTSFGIPYNGFNNEKYISTFSIFKN